MKSVKQSILFHERPITDLKFHEDGDVFFASSKDASASMMNLEGKVLGSFDKHEGAISTIASHGNVLTTAGLDLTLIQWDVLTGCPISSIPTDSVIRGLHFIDQIYFCTDDSMNKRSFVGMYDPRVGKAGTIIFLNDPSTKIFKYDNYLIISMVNGTVCKLDLRTNKMIQDIKIHQARITDMRPSACSSFFITSSSDSSASIIDSDTFATKKKFDTEEPINSACIFSTNDKVLCVGGINARDVTTTRGKSSFDTSFFDIVTQQKIGSYTTHFGTINSVDVHPGCTHYISGGEDGSVCLVRLGSDFLAAPFTNFNQ